MPIFETIKAVHEYTRDPQYAYLANNEKLLMRLLDVFARTWDLGFIAFGGPPVHFQILYQRFVQGQGDKTPWLDEETYQELFAIVQTLPGPGSTKMLFCIAHVHAGFLPALLVFLLWSLPGAIGMFVLSLGVQRIGDVLPGAVYALLSGLNASTVGIVALAAVQLAEKSIKDDLTRILVIFGACAGLCYNALWYFPVLLVSGGLVTGIWDTRLRQLVMRLRRRWKARRTAQPGSEAGVANDSSSTQSPTITLRSPNTGLDRQGLQRRNLASLSESGPSRSGANENFERDESFTAIDVGASPTDIKSHVISVRRGCIILCSFFATFITVLVVRATVKDPQLPLSLFTSMYLAGTIIFGGGPVVIPLLRDYVVEPGWVTSRDFLIGLAIIQACPGPNFNFAVYLGALALARADSPPTFVGALLGFLGIFAPGIILSVGIQSLWSVWRTKPVVMALLRGINATAIGLVFTAVYRLWQIGYLTPNNSQGQSLALEPWWVVVAVVAYAEACWFHVPPALAILIGAGLGLAWYGAVGRHLA